MANLHGLVRGAITLVNPDQRGRVRISAGYATGSTGKRTPTYAPDVSVTVQVQDLSQRDILHLNSLNIQGSQKVLYLSGQIAGLSREEQKGGDLVVLSDGKWLVTAVLESWPNSGWCRVAVTRQMG